MQMQEVRSALEQGVAATYAQPRATAISDSLQHFMFTSLTLDGAVGCSAALSMVDLLLQPHDMPPNGCALVLLCIADMQVRSAAAGSTML